MKRRICVVITARPSYSRIKTALSAIIRHPDLELKLVVAGSALLDRYGNAVDVIEGDGFNIDARVYMILEGENLVTSAKSTGIALSELAGVFDNIRPDMVVTIADRYETLATATAASYMNIPLVHVQGGEVSGSIDDRVRHAISKLANIHLVSTKGAAERLCRMGEDPSAVYVTGCPSIDIAAEVLEKPSLDFSPTERYIGVGSPVDLSNGFWSCCSILSRQSTRRRGRRRSQRCKRCMASTCRCYGSGLTSMPARTAHQRPSARSAKRRGQEHPLLQEHDRRPLSASRAVAVALWELLRRISGDAYLPRRSRWGEHWFPATGREPG